MNGQDTKRPAAESERFGVSGYLVLATTAEEPGKKFKAASRASGNLKPEVAERVPLIGGVRPFPRRAEVPAHESWNLRQV